MRDHLLIRIFLAWTLAPLAFVLIQLFLCGAVA